MADQKNLDAQFARAIMGDGKFRVRTVLFYLDIRLMSCLRMTWIISTRTPKNLVDRRCVQTL